MKLDGVYYPLNDSISWLTTCMEEMKQDIARIQNAADVARPPSIDRRRPQSIDIRQSPSLDIYQHTSIDNRLATSIDTNPPPPHTIRSQPDFHTREEIDQLVIKKKKEDPSRRLPYVSTDANKSTSIDIASPASTDNNILESVDIYSGLEPKLTSNTKPDTTACLGAWYTWDHILQTSLEGVVDRCSGTPVDRSWLVYVDRCSVVGVDRHQYDPPKLIKLSTSKSPSCSFSSFTTCQMSPLLSEQVSKAQPLVAVQYRSMSEMECRSMSGEGYRSTEGVCCRSIGVSENRSTGLVSGSTVVEQTRATRSCCCRSIGSALPYGTCILNLQDLVRIAVGIPCCFWYCWACT
ncbi:hypothetical protein F2Q70_00029904 [Brassica cretica]|uniref:Uncharacterized protein n=1 Tax=Brassica cretica TaxID=69181 RepID=A0A8S9FLM3_BRACR|nr:hypothetical protein F2Q70_00029904 [Brassica cretica]